MVRLPAGRSSRLYPPGVSFRSNVVALAALVLVLGAGFGAATSLINDVSSPTGYSAAGWWTQTGRGSQESQVSRAS